MRLAWLLLLCACACQDLERVYRCQRDAQCVDGEGRAGRCVEHGCAWLDSGCPTGLRFDISAGSGRSGVCVGQEGPEPAPVFSLLPLPDGHRETHRLGPVFGAGARVYVCGWDGQSFLLRWDEGGVRRLPVPLGGETVRAAAAEGEHLALATPTRLLRSADAGMSFHQQDRAGIEALHHDGALLHLLVGGQVESWRPDGTQADLLAAPEGGVVALAGQGSQAIALVHGAGGQSVLYRRDHGRWQRAGAAMEALQAVAAGGGVWAAAGPGLLLVDGMASPGPPEGAVELALGARDDVWLRVPGRPYLLRQRGGTLREVRPDPAAEVYASLWVSRPAAGAQLWVVSRVLVDRSLRARLWRAAVP
ncbi:MAG: hypothetical protein RMK29_09200 [Myxococcales bacterium]|nr:hypothetical protein [Myxococcota bacterium]MDW8281875.1 hypothetical protein [Myxococcales bacterium]